MVKIIYMPIESSIHQRPPSLWSTDIRIIASGIILLLDTCHETALLYPLRKRHRRQLHIELPPELLYAVKLHTRYLVDHSSSPSLQGMSQLLVKNSTPQSIQYIGGERVQNPQMHVCMYTTTALRFNRSEIRHDHTENAGEQHGRHTINISPTCSADIDTDNMQEEKLHHCIEENSLTHGIRCHHTKHLLL